MLSRGKINRRLRQMAHRVMTSILTDKTNALSVSYHEIIFVTP